MFSTQKDPFFVTNIPQFRDQEWSGPWEVCVVVGVYYFFHLLLNNASCIIRTGLKFYVDAVATTVRTKPLKNKLFYKVGRACTVDTFR